MINIINDFIKMIEKKNLMVEAIALSNKEEMLICRHFINVKERNIYSHTKSYVSLACGIAIDEGLISLDSKLMDYLKDDIDYEIDTKVYDITLRDLLTMSSGFDKFYLPYNLRMKGEGFPDYLKYIITNEIKKEPGSSFCYSSSDSYLIGRMLQKATNKNLKEYIYEKLLSKMDSYPPIWETDFKGNPTGGSGLVYSIEEINKFGRLLLNDGMYNNQQLVSKQWIDEACKVQISTNSSIESLDLGYGYHFWPLIYKNVYKASGMYGQETFIFKDLGYTFSIMCPDNGNFDLVFKEMKECIFDRLEKENKIIKIKRL